MNRDHYITTRGGKTYILYSGLLDMAHSRGLISIDTDLIQTPDDEADRSVLPPGQRFGDGGR